MSILKRVFVLCRPGDDLLSQVLRHSTIGADAFDGRVRDGIGSGHVARATRPAKNEVEATMGFDVFCVCACSGMSGAGRRLVMSD